VQLHPRRGAEPPDRTDAHTRRRSTAAAPARRLDRCGHRPPRRATSPRCAQRTSAHLRPRRASLESRPGGATAAAWRAGKGATPSRAAPTDFTSQSTSPGWSRRSMRLDPTASSRLTARRPRAARLPPAPRRPGAGPAGSSETQVPAPDRASQRRVARPPLRSARGHQRHSRPGTSRSRQRPRSGMCALDRAPPELQTARNRLGACE